MCRQVMYKWCWISMVLLGLAAPALGQVTINQSKANAGNVTPGDGAGFPVTISRPGSYRLTSNLTVSGVNRTAIRVNADNVSIDLSGFVIRGPVVCSEFGASLSCSPRGFGRGIDAPNSSGTVVSDGEVQGMGIGLALGTGGTTLEGANRVEQVTVRNSFDSGMSVQGGIVTRCIANSNGGDGIFVSGGTVINNMAVGNRAAGITVGETGTVLDNNASFNGGTGLALGSQRVGYGNNVLSGNNIDVSGGTQIGTNLCGGAICP